MKKRVTLNTTRSGLYTVARILGHIQAGKRSLETGSLAPIGKRIGRVLLGRAMGQVSRILFPPK